MATPLSRSDYKSRYNNATTGKYKANVTQSITSAEHRDMIDNSDSFFNVADDSYTGAFPQVTATGTNTYAATLSPVITAYATGQKFQIKFSNASSSVSTLNLNSVGAKKIFINPTTQATTGHIVANQISLLAYDATLDAAVGGFLMLGSATDTSGFLTTATYRRVREVTGASASVQADDNGLVIFNSATPFNFTLDQLTADVAGNQTTKITFVNYGAGAVTFTNGSGVTLAGSPILPGATGTTYPSAVVIYDTLTTPRVISGTSKIDLNIPSTAGGTITFDCNNQVERMFVGSASFGTAKAIALSNDGFALVINFVFTLTNVAAVLTFPSTFTMQAADSRWADGAGTFTPQTTGKHEFSATWDGTDWNLKATTPYS